MIAEALTGAIGVALGGALAERRGRSLLPVRPLFAASQYPPARFLHITPVFGEPGREAILERVRARLAELRPSDVTGDDKTYRKSRVLYYAKDVAPELVQWIDTSAPMLAQALSIPPFPKGDVEAQLTVSGPGDYFKRHDDNGCPETAPRRLSWVYYVHPGPKRFQGGEFRMYGAGPNGRDAYSVEPASDTLIVFPSECFHEVMSVVSSSPALEDARVTLNGWVRRS